MSDKNFSFFVRLLAFSLFACLLQACSAGGASRAAKCVGDTIAMSHSSLLCMVDCDSFFVVDVKNPWVEAQSKRYLLVPKDAPLPCAMPHGTLLRTPLERALVFSSVHVSLFEKMAPAAMKGVCDARYMLSNTVRERIKRGDLADCGSSLDVDVERVAQLSPDAVLLHPFENGGHGKIEKLSFPIVECVEYMEPSPLAAAEWMRFYGRLLGRAAFADSLFAAVCEEYENLVARAAGASSRPTLMCELKSSSAWYMPAGESTMGRMYREAGADYLFAVGEGQGSVPLSFETVLARAADADYWLFKYNSSVDKSRASLLADFSGYALFRPFKEGRVYACNTAKKTLFEDTFFRPDLLLAELIAIFHPSLMEGYSLKYYERVP